MYTSPKASEITNGKRSQYFQPSRGTRQGSPISPLLFALAIDPLSITHKTLPSITGIHRRGREHRAALYAGDLYVSDPVSCAPPIIHTLRRFGAFLGMKLTSVKVNVSVNDLALQIQDDALPFHMSRNSFKYLGINITRDMQNLYQENFCLLFEKVKLD